MLQAKIVADSLSPQKNRLTTLLVTMPRYILAELNTHRMLGKNSASSRAIPFKKMINSVMDNPFIPMAWMKDHSGMQGSEYVTDEKIIALRRDMWLRARDSAIKSAEELNRHILVSYPDKVGFAIQDKPHEDGQPITKQMCNRLLEPFMWHTVLISGTEWDNFFELRCPQYEVNNKIYRSTRDAILDDKYDTFGGGNIGAYFMTINKGQADIHMMATAEAIWDAMNESAPKQLEAGEWHIPFEDKINEGSANFGALMSNKEIHDTSKEEYFKIIYNLKIKISTAMAARTSYTVVGDEKEISYDKLIGIHDRMMNQVPFHASPFEHCARAMSSEEYEISNKTFINGFTATNNDGSPLQRTEYGWCRNYRGFTQYRHILETNKN